MSRTTASATERLGLIDADGILYAAALEGQTECDGVAMALLDISAVYRRLLVRVEKSMKAGKVDDAILCLSDRRNFRNAIMPVGHPCSVKQLGYKGQRKVSDRPILLDQLRAMVVEMKPYPVMLIEGLEADDVCGIAQGQLTRLGRTTVIISPDKDMLTIPGEIATPDRSGKVTFTKQTKSAADRWHMYQTLVGDTVDNYTGCPGFGPRKAGNLLDMFDEECLTPAQRWGEIIKAFADRGLSRKDCLEQAQVSRILRVDDWDSINKVPRLFHFPQV